MSNLIYTYFPSSGDDIKCIICQYAYRKDAPLPTLQKHLRVKHGFSVRNPLSPEELEKAIKKARIPIFTPYLAPPEYKPVAQKPKSESPKRVNIGNPLNTKEHTGEASSRAIELSIVNWVIKEKIPLAVASTESFYSMLRQINPNVSLPTHKRLHQLVSAEFRTILEGVSVSSSSHPPTPESSSEKAICPRQ
ncbi:hypothetical protein DSO57_1008949 [Entomophthora muscae]|uniref:Uncharacterized protein n=1 Tax=Entomophthora muscae TaxID=34485 RepID=A0ACC2U6E0_9FUNG|nr:hypothetical protein DSO57_1008949 [Entomophthora muscae]